MALTAETASGFYYWFELNYSMYATDLRPIFRFGSLTGADDCCEIGLRSLKGRCHGNQFLYPIYTIFFVTVTTV